MSSSKNTETCVQKVAWGGAGSPISLSENERLSSFKDLMSEDLAKDMQEK